MSITDTVIEIVNAAIAEGADPALWVQDYFAEKGSHFSRAKIEYIISHAFGVDVPA